MKKIFLFILIFVGMFFINMKETYALKCKVGSGDCADKATFIEKVKEETNGGNVVCLYEVQFKGSKYYNYIYYNGIEDIVMGGTSYGAKDKPIRNDRNAYLLGDAYNNFFNNYTCPTNSYIDKSAVNEVCFDNSGECKNNGEMYNASTNFNDTNESKLVNSNTGVLSLKDLSFKNACNRIPDGYDKVCRYTGQQDTVIIYYNDSSYQLQYRNDETGQRLSINKGESKKFNEEDIGYAIAYDEYVGNLTITNSCPETIYLNKYWVYVIRDSYNEYQDDIKYDKIISQYSFEEKKATPGINGKFTIGNKDYETFESQTLKYQRCDIDITGDEQADPETCEDLIDKDLLNIINEIMNIIKIAIPIMLIGLIIFDLASAILSSSDDKINKAKKRAINRVIIAVVIFFVPTLINFVLNIVNDVWGKNYGICEIEEKTE